MLSHFSGYSLCYNFRYIGNFETVFEKDLSKHCRYVFIKINWPMIECYFPVDNSPSSAKVYVKIYYFRNISEALSYYQTDN